VVVNEHFVRTDVSRARKMNGIETSHAGRQIHRVIQDQSRDVDEEVRTEKPLRLGSVVSLEIRSDERASDLDGSDSARGDNRFLVSDVTLERGRFSFLDDQLDQSRRVRVDEQRASVLPAIALKSLARSHWPCDASSTDRSRQRLGATDIAAGNEALDPSLGQRRKKRYRLAVVGNLDAFAVPYPPDGLGEVVAKFPDTHARGHL
jgi:hypothetical protein